MTAAALVLVLGLVAQAPGGTAQAFDPELEGGRGFELELVEPASRIDFDAAIEAAVEEVLQERDPETGRFVAGEPDPSFQTMLYQGLDDPAELVFIAASVADMWSRSAVNDLCKDHPDVLACDTGMSVQVDALLTAGVYAGVTGIQRLAKKYWDVDLDSGWKDWLIFGGLAGVRFAFTWSNVALANDIRSLQ